MTVELQDSSQSQSASAVTVATSSMVHSSVADPGNMNIGFGSSRDCFSHNAPPPPPMHMHIPPEMTLRSDGSLYILDSINRSQNEDWHLKNLEQTRSMQDAAESQQHLISADLSMLVGGRSDHMCSDSRYDHSMIC